MRSRDGERWVSSIVTKYDERFEEKFQSLPDEEVRITTLGRARAGIYLLAKLARRDDRNRVIMLHDKICDVVNMVGSARCELVFVDTLPNSTNVDVDHLVMAIDDSVCCVLLTHYHVNQNQLDDVRDICRKHEIPLFGDCAIVRSGNAEALHSAHARTQVFSACRSSRY